MNAVNSTTNFAPRDWQHKFMQQAVKLALRGVNDFLLSATPGSGKTLAGLYLLHQLMALKNVAIQKAIIVCPSTELLDQWVKKSATFGLNFMTSNNRKFDLSTGSLLDDVHGFATTYAYLAAGNNADSVADYLKRHGVTMAIADEIHHAGIDSRGENHPAWGQAVAYALDSCRFRLALSGTPFRKEGNIPFVSYEVDLDGVEKASPDYSYTYKQALSDGVCRTVSFEKVDGTISWSTGGKQFKEDLSVDFTQIKIGGGFKGKKDELKSKQWAAARRVDGAYWHTMFTKANDRLKSIRQRGGYHARAGGLVICANKKEADEKAQSIKEITGVYPEVVYGELNDASERIDRFREGSAPWLVSVLMISEGVDIPRLRVGVYMSDRLNAELFFRQIVGRFVRIEDQQNGMNEEGAAVFIPDIPQLRQYALEIEKERDDISSAAKAHLKLTSPAMVRKINDDDGAVESSAEMTGAIHSGHDFSQETIDRVENIRHLLPASYRHRHPAEIALAIQVTKLIGGGV